jgi:hypothetical protein
MYSDRLKSLGIEDIFNTYTAPPMAVALDDNTKTLYHT